MTERPAHSPLGASSAERWMECPGSVGLLRRNLSLAESDEPDYRAEGTAAHSALERCLREKTDAWEIVGWKTPNGREVTVEMADAIQVFLDTVRGPAYTEEWIEHSLDNPDFHPLFYGTLDQGGLRLDFDEISNEVWTLDINDFKYGQGVIVEVWHNPQVMYYAFGKLAQLWLRGIYPDLVRLRIIQPRGFHPEGPVRTWVVDADVIKKWAENELKPAMLRTATDTALNPGPHCRFCPAKLVCPVMVALFEAAVGADPKRVVDLTDPGLDAQYPMVEAVKHYLKALEAETYNRLLHGKEFTHSKLVHKKANRVWKPGAEDVLKLHTKEIYTAPEMKSPAEVEKLGGDIKKLVHEYAFTPESGLTVATTSDKRVAVKVPKAAETFAAFLNANGDDT